MRMRQDKGPWLLAPVLLFLAAFFIGPLLVLLARSVTEPQPGLGNFALLLGSPTFLTILYNTIVTGLVVTLVTLAIAFPVAWYVVLAGPRAASLVLGIVVVSMWTSLLARLFALVILLGGNGPVNKALLSLGLIGDPLAMVNNFTGLLIGMVYLMLPFMLMPIRDTLATIDPALMQAAAICGAGPWTVFRRVLLPLAMPGISTGSVIVFVSTLGYFVVPTTLGGPRDLMIAGFIVERIQRFLDWGVGTAAAICLLVLTLAIYTSYMLLVGHGRTAGGAHAADAQ